MSKNLFKRILTCVVGIPLLVLLIFYFPQYNFIGLSILVIIMAFLGSYEMSKLVFGKFEPFVITSAIIPIMQYIQQLKNTATDITSYYVAVFIVFTLAIEIGISGTEDSFEGSIERSGKRLLLFFYPSFLLAFLIKILAMPAINAYSVLLFLVLVFSNDIFAYVFGMLFGKGKGVVFKVSPKKSHAGFIGGHLSCIGICFAYCAIFRNHLPEMPWVFKFELGLVISMTANLGDLIESVFKRSANVKDSGSIVPGRGGILDSIDSIIASAPFFYILYSIVTK